MKPALTVAIGIAVMSAATLVGQNAGDPSTSLGAGPRLRSGRAPAFPQRATGSVP
jgi:hypothetical protein